MNVSKSNRIIATPSSLAKSHFLFVQEVGSLQSIIPHLSKRNQLHSFLFFVVTKGNGTLFHGGNEYPLESGDCVFLNCLEEYGHQSSSSNPWELSWVHFYGNQMNPFFKLYTKQWQAPFFRPNSIDEYLNIINNLFTHTKEQTPKSEYMNHKYLTDLTCLLLNTEQVEQLGQSITEKIKEIKDYIDNNYMNSISLEDLSSRFFISKYHLSREFKKNLGITLGNYLLNKRLSNAKHLLRFSDLSIEDISLQCGFVDPSYFIKVFKKSENLTPNQYRKKW